MSESVNVGDDNSGQGTAQEMTAGALLRAAREASGLHIAALAVAMKVPVKKLEALEADRYEALPDAVFVRALASGVCRALKVDPEPILAKLPHLHKPRLVSADVGINTPFQSHKFAGTFSTPSIGKPAVITVVILLLALLGVLFFPEYSSDVKKTAELEVVAETSAPVVLPSSTVPSSGPAAPSEVIVPAGSVAIEAPQLVASAGVEPALAADVAGVGTGTVAFRVRGSSWIEVTDAKGVVSLRRMLSQGETAGASGALPLSVIVGRADVTEVEVRGKPFSLDAVTSKDNVARFEVK
jgi:cytoskeleton protein RodZ